MGIHEYLCPTCHSAQRVKAQPGEIVEVQDCEACARAKAESDELDTLAEEVVATAQRHEREDRARKR